MNEVIIWAQFAGAWLLVAGPLYQGSVELDELDIDREGIEGIKSSAVGAAPGRPSPWWWWWWLLPPVMYVLHRRWTRTLRQVTLAQLTEAQVGQITSFRNKATGWCTVAAGALLLAAGESWQITRRYDWSGWVFWLLVAVMLVGCLLNTAIRMISGHHARTPPVAGAVPGPAV